LAGSKNPSSVTSKARIIGFNPKDGVFSLADLSLIAVSSINYLLTFIGVGLIAVGIYYFVDTTSFAAQ